jgi:hypothetical protein
MCILLSSVCSFVTLGDSSHVQWGLLFTCRVVNRRVGVLTWLCWFAPFVVVLAFNALNANTTTKEAIKTSLEQTQR